MSKISNIIQATSWKRVLNAARRTVGKKPIDKEPSDIWKAKILLAEHSPIRLLEYDITIEDIRQWVTTHLVRHHEGCEKFVHTQRQDINEEIERLTKKLIEVLTEAGMLHDGWKERDYLFQGQENTMDMTCNAQAFINISRRRLCSTASAETRLVWQQVKDAIREVDPVLADKMVRECLYRSFCPEFDRCCGFVNTPQFKRELVHYQSIEVEDSWTKIEGFENYEVSRRGKVRRLPYTDSLGRFHAMSMVSIVNNPERGGYEYVHLKKDGKGYCKSLHRLVAITFIPNPDNKPEVNHKDGNKFNNMVSNLEWVTSIENKQHAWSTGLCSSEHKKVKVLCLETGEIYNSIVEASEKLEVDRRSIFRVLSGAVKAAKGYTFQRCRFRKRK